MDTCVAAVLLSSALGRRSFFVPAVRYCSEGSLSLIGCLISGSIGAILLLSLGIAVPLAGGTDFNGVPRVAGAMLAIVVWLIGVAASAHARRWQWFAGILVLGPIPLVLYGTNVSNDFTYPEQWSTFARQPWYLIALMLSPLPLLAYGLVQFRGDS